MKSSSFLSAGIAVLSLSACSPSTPSADSSASVSETAAATLAGDTVDTSDTTVTETVASSAATVVVTQAETYDPVVIKQMGQRPGYWEVKHTNPKTQKSYVTHICVDKALGARMTKQGPISPPSDHRDYKDDANFKGACPTGFQGGDIEKNDGRKINAYGDHKPQQVYSDHDHDHDQAPTKGNAAPGQDIHPDDHKDHSSRTPEPSHNPHTTPAEDHANDRPDKNHADRSSHPGDNRP